MSLRLKLLFLSLTTLVLPWAGCQYASEMESALRTAEEQALAGVAQTLAASLQGRTDLLYRAANGDVAQFSDYDLAPIVLPGAPVLDGYADDWPESPSSWKTFDQGSDRLRVLTGLHERMLYLLLEVRDHRVVFDAQDATPLEPETFGDRIWLGFSNPEGAEHQVLIAATSAGPIQARHIETREFGQEVSVSEPRIAGAWQLKSAGYRVELRVPLSMLGARLGVLVDDRDQRGAAPTSYGSLRPTDLHTRGRLIAAAPELSVYLNQFLQPGLLLVIATPRGLPLAQASEPAAADTLTMNRSFLDRLYRRFLDRPGERRVVAATAPINDREQRRAIGQLQVTQSTDRWLTLRDRALTTLLNFTLVTSLIAVLAMFAFAAHLALRLSRLRNASESALTRAGLVTTFPETESPDELGDVARGFATLLARLDEYTGYLRTLAGKLAHEIRTPLTIVRSSLENLESESPPSAAARPYLDRAREGSERLNAILVAMSAATRVEEAINQSERSRFDLVPLVSAAVAAYRSAFPARAFEFEPPQSPLSIEGAPDLVMQLLDKLIDNAVDFSPSGSTLTVRLARDGEGARLDVENCGPELAQENRSRIFESLWQSRVDGDSRPHFGLGLYIVRLITEFHQGHARAENLVDGSGVRFSVYFPFMRRQ